MKSEAQPSPSVPVERIPRRTRAEKNAATTRALLDAAAAAFAERGYDAATMDEIARRVGLTKGALYYRYRSKEALFLALLDEQLDRYIEELRGAMTSGPSPISDPAAAGEAFAQRIAGDWPRLFIEFVAYADRTGGEPRRELRRRMRQLRRTVSATIRGGTEDLGLVLPLEAEHLSLAVIALASGWAVERLAEPSGVSGELFGEMVELLILGVRARAQRNL